MSLDKKIAALRAEMQAKKIDAYIVPSSDQHLSEYPVDHWKSRAWLTDFHGSAATVVVTQDAVNFWTDGRYHTFAKELFADSPITLFKQGIPGVPSYDKWIAENMPKGTVVGFDGRLFSATALRNFTTLFVEENEMTLETSYDLFATVWQDRPALPVEKSFDFKVKYAGKSRNEKIEELREKMAELKADTFILSVIDDIAWLFNIRLDDAMPAFGQAFAIITKTEAIYFGSDASLVDVKESLTADGIVIKPYDSIADEVAKMTAEQTVLFDPAKLNSALFQAIPEACGQVEKANPTNLMKSIKNETEIVCTRNAHIKDGVAMVKFIHWLYNTVGKETLTEYGAAEKLEAFRREQPDSFGPSFTTIPGYMANGAMMHYSADPVNSAELKPEGFFLVDSGGQYIDGLTDTTRTFALGAVTDEMKKHYTLVLKGVLALSLAKYMKGTRGCNLDYLARQPLWNEGLDYRCGTGHGVGYFLNVHEGPQNFSQGLTDVAFVPGMMTTVEPGCYLEGKYGIRIENILLTVEDKKTEFGEFYKFEYLTLCPIDTTPVIPELLSPEEREYLNNYHADVYKQLSPGLTADEQAWLKTATAAI